MSTPASEQRSWLLRLYRRYLRAPDHRGKLRITRLLERLLIADSGAVFSVHPGFDMILHPRDLLEQRLIRTGSYEPLTLEFLSRNLALGDIALLAGINIGLHAMTCSRAVGPNGFILGVEPQPTSLPRSRANFLLNSLPDNIILVSAAIGAKHGFLPMSEAPAECSGWGTLVLRENGRFPYQVATHTVPELLSEFNIPKLDLMLLDVEGFELPVLQAMGGSSQPAILVLEVHPPVLEILRTDPRAYYDAVYKLGYSCFDLHGNPAHPDCRLPESNLICVLGDPAGIKWIA